MGIWLWILLLCFLLLLAGIICCYIWISIVANPYIYSLSGKVPFRENALLLGTAKFTKKGGMNAFFIYRIAKATEIYQAHQAARILVSGADKIPHSPDEVTDMVQSLLEEGIRPEDILADHNGSRTWASLWRCKHLFNISSPLIISQHFHNQRAIFIALRLKMAPIAIDAEMVGGPAGKRMILREALARVKCLMDCYLFKPEYP